MFDRNSRFLAVAFLLGSLGAAQAADILSAPEIVAAAPASRFYVRGDVSYDFSSDLDVTQRIVDPTGTLVSGFSRLDLDEGFDGGVGIGYQATDWLRTDATFHYWKDELTTTATDSLICAGDPACNALGGAGDLEAYELMANVYADLGTFAGFTPYVGGGLGAVHLSYDDTSISLDAGGGCDVSDPCGGPADPVGSIGFKGENSWRFAYALNAGVAYNMTQSLALDVGYRYLNVDGGDTYSFDGASIGAPGSKILGEDDGFDRHTIQLGLRYKFG